MTHPAPSPDPTPMPTPLPTPTPFVEPGPRERAYSNAFELLVLAELARADGDPLSAVDLTNRAASEFEDLGMHGPVILGLVLDMCGDARREARRRRSETDLDVEGFFAWLTAEPETAA